jgi:hypothetical protein
MNKLLLSALCLGIVAGAAQAAPKRLTDMQLDRISAGDGMGNNNGNGNLGNNNGNGNLGNNNGNGNMGNGSDSGGPAAAAPAADTASTAGPAIAVGIDSAGLIEIARFNGLRIDGLDANAITALSRVSPIQFGVLNGQLTLVPIGAASR